eukprot:9342009-Karenia_brevis.AAC.1
MLGSNSEVCTMSETAVCNTSPMVSGAVAPTQLDEVTVLAPSVVLCPLTGELVTSPVAASH